MPVPRFYERLMGRLPTDAEWLVMDEAFHRHYSTHRLGCELAEGVHQLLEGWQSAGRSQSILSMYGHDELLPIVRDFGIESRFVRVEGRPGPPEARRARIWCGIWRRWRAWIPAARS